VLATGADIEDLVRDIFFQAGDLNRERHRLVREMVT
jgi:hypothetical protein